MPKSLLKISQTATHENDPVAVADLRGSPYGPKFSQNHAVLWKIWQKSYVAPLWRVGASSYR